MPKTNWRSRKSHAGVLDARPFVAVSDVICSVIKLFSLRRWIDNDGPSSAASLSSDRAWHSDSGHCSLGHPVEFARGPPPLRANSIHQSSCQTKSPDKEGEKSANEKSENSGGRQSGTGGKTEWDSVSGVSERKIYCSARKSDLSAKKRDENIIILLRQTSPHRGLRGVLEKSNIDWMYKMSTLFSCISNELYANN